MALTFDWDSKRAKQNLKKQEVSFEEAATVFNDPFSFTITDPTDTDNSGRFVILGKSTWQRLLVVLHTEDQDQIRILGARLANRNEKDNYERGLAHL